MNFWNECQVELGDMQYQTVNVEFKKAHGHLSVQTVEIYRQDGSAVDITEFFSDDALDALKDEGYSYLRELRECAAEENADRIREERLLRSAA